MWVRLSLGVLCLICLFALAGDALERSVPVTVTAYCDHLQPTASGLHVRPGFLAVSRDLEPLLGLHFGDRLRLEPYGVFQFQDRMHARWRRKTDLFLRSCAQARQFGKQRGVLSVTR